MAFYDLSCSSCYGTCCELAKRGYNRDGLKLPAVEYGLLTDREGRPISVQVYPDWNGACPPRGCFIGPHCLFTAENGIIFG